jgi:hypothetical protein
LPLFSDRGIKKNQPTIAELKIAVQLEIETSSKEITVVWPRHSSGG